MLDRPPIVLNTVRKTANKTHIAAIKTPDLWSKKMFPEEKVVKVINAVARALKKSSIFLSTDGGTQSLSSFCSSSWSLRSQI